MSGCSGPSTFSRIASARSIERPRPREVALVLQQDGEVVEARRGVGVLGAERLLADRQRALDRAAAPPPGRPGPEAGGEVVEARRRVGVLGAEHLLADRQRALEERPRRRKVALGLQQAARLLRLVAVLGCRASTSSDRQARSREAAFVAKYAGRAPRRGPTRSWPRRRQVALNLQQEGEVVEARRGVGMLGAEHLLVDGRAAPGRGEAPVRSPWACSRPPRLLRLLAVSGWSARARSR